MKALRLFLTHRLAVALPADGYPPTRRLFPTTVHHRIGSVFHAHTHRPTADKTFGMDYLTKPIQASMKHRGPAIHWPQLESVHGRCPDPEISSAHKSQTTRP